MSDYDEPMEPLRVHFREPPRGAEGHAGRVAFAAFLEELDRPTPARAPRAIRTDAQRASEALSRRLRTLAGHIDAFAGIIEMNHGDASGNAHWGFLRGRFDAQWADLWSRLERVRKDADAGCTRSAAFVAQWAAILQLAGELRNEKPPPRVVGYRITPVPDARRLDGGAVERGD